MLNLFPIRICNVPTERRLRFHSESCSAIRWHKVTSRIAARLSPVTQPNVGDTAQDSPLPARTPRFTTTVTRKHTRWRGSIPNSLYLRRKTSDQSNSNSRRRLPQRQATLLSHVSELQKHIGDNLWQTAFSIGYSFRAGFERRRTSSCRIENVRRRAPRIHS